MSRQHKAEVMIAGEQLRYERSGVRALLGPEVTFDLLLTSRLRLHDGKLIKDRRYHLRTYPNCFVAQELVDWIVSHREAPDRATAVCLLQHLMDHDIIHHGRLPKHRGQDGRQPQFQLHFYLMFPVCDHRHVFKDAKLLYRFRKDDGTFPFNTEVKIFMRGQRLYEQ